MALHKRLVLSVLIGASLLAIYVLCLHLEQLHGPPTGANSRPRHSEDAPPSPADSYGVTERAVGRPPPPTSPQRPATPAGASKGHPADAAPKAAESDVKKASKPGDVGGAGAGAPTVQPPPKPPRTTEPTFIGDTYASEDVAPTTECSDGVRRRVGATEFGARFLERLPVLQWAKHATRAEHRRLSQYPGAHGWGNIDYDALQRTLSVLNSHANGQMLDDWKTRRGNASECSRCAVVGNGGILKGSKKGEEIDGHHYVFRTNGAITQGFEEDVGSRTTHYTFSTNTLMNSMRSYAGAGYKGPPVSKETRYIFLPDHDRDYLLMMAAATHTPVESGREKGKRPEQYFGEDVSVEKLKMYHPDFIRYLRNRFLRSNALKTKYRDIYRPSTGATMLLAALHTCDQVSAYGFMTPDYASYSDHYYDSTFHKVGFYINHDLRMELLLWQELHHAGLLRLYMRQEAGGRVQREAPPSSG